MAGHYFYDPRPFYGHNGHTGLMPLDELFYGRYDPVVPYWMDQRMTSFDFYYPASLKQRRGPEQMQQQYHSQRGENNLMAYKRPELVRDDSYIDFYQRSPYNFRCYNNNNYGRDGFGVAPTTHPEYMRQQQLRGRSQDDLWVPASYGHGQEYRGLPEPPPGDMASRALSNGAGIHQFYPNDQGGDQYRQMEINGNNHSKGLGNHSHSNLSHGNSSHGNGHGHGQGNSHGNSHGTAHGTLGSKQMGVSGISTGKSSSMQTSKQSIIKNTKRYSSSSNSDAEDDDDFQKGGNNGGNTEWGPVKSTHGHQCGKITSAHGHKVDHSSHGYASHGGGVKSIHSSLSTSSKKSSSHGRGGHSKISKLLGFGNDDSSSSEEDESYIGRHGSKEGSEGSSKEHGGHGASSHSNYGSQPKQMQFSSQSKSVELKVPICCDNCERKVRSCLEKMHGVEGVLCNQWNWKVIVYGNLKADDVLKRVRRVKKTSELWSNAKQQQQQQLVRLY